VRLQNRYWPFVRGSSRLLPRPGGGHDDPFRDDAFDAAAVLSELGVTEADIKVLYRYFSARGQTLEFGDRLHLLRQMASRTYRRRLGGTALRAQDCYDAGEVLRRFYRDLTGEVLPDAEVTAAGVTDEELAHRSQIRERQLGHPPRLQYDAEDVKRVLDGLGIYPHGIHVIVEGETEELVVPGIVKGLLGDDAAADLVVTNLHGVGAAADIDNLLGAVTQYSLRAVVIADNEGNIRASVDRLIADGLLDPADVLVQETSFEEDNFSDQELVDLAIRAAAVARGSRAAAELKLTAEELRAYHDDRVERSDRKDRPALASSLVTLARRPEHGAVELSKSEDLAPAILRHLLDELNGTTGSADVELRASARPAFNHIVQRVVKPLAMAPSDRPRPRREL
jgi:hypothetical protein